MTADATNELTAEEFSDGLYDLLWGHARGAVATTVDQAYEMIWKYLIVRGARGGDRLSDVTLSGLFGLSRTPVRQALQRLAHEGVVQVDPNRGFFVRMFTAQDVHEIYDLRGALEVLALRLAAPYLDPADLTAQLDLVDTLRARLAERPVGPFLQNDLRLHNVIVHTSGNSRLIRFAATLRSQLSFFQVRNTLYPGYPHRMEAALDDHERILRSLLARNIEEATEHLATHIANAKALVLTDLLRAEANASLPPT